jgi:hypothetical protein
MVCVDHVARGEHHLASATPGFTVHINQPATIHADERDDIAEAIDRDIERFGNDPLGVGPGSIWSNQLNATGEDGRVMASRCRGNVERSRVVWNRHNGLLDPWG